MKKIICVILSVFFLTGCSAHASVQRMISKTIDIDVKNGTEVSFYSTHGGFFGDGVTAAALSFSDDSVLNQIEEKSDWSSLPLSYNLASLVYGGENDGLIIQSFLKDKTGSLLIPKIENGYYYFLDHNSDSREKHDGADIFSRFSFNFAIAIYDTDANILYFAELDT